MQTCRLIGLLICRLIDALTTPLLPLQFMPTEILATFAAKSDLRV